MRYLERITHVHEMNRFLERHPDLTGYDFIRCVLAEELHATATIDGLENLPAGDRPCIFVSNHPLGGLDGMIIALMLGDHHRRPLKVIVNDLLMQVVPLQCLWAPVNIVGSQTRDYALRQREMWESDADILTFPAGACSRRQWLDHRFVIRDLDWKKSFIQKAQTNHRDVVPIRFEGHNSRFFYALAYWRKKLGIRVNIEMLYLVDEMYKARGSHFAVHVLPPIPYTTFDASRTPAQWAEYVKATIYGTHHTHSR